MDSTLWHNKANQFDCKHNAICRILTEAGGLNNSEYSNPMYDMFTKVRKEIPKHNHMSNADKLTSMSEMWRKQEVGFIS